MNYVLNLVLWSDPFVKGGGFPPRLSFPLPSQFDARLDGRSEEDDK